MEFAALAGVERDLCRLHWEARASSSGETPQRKPGKEISDGGIVDVAALLAEVEKPGVEQQISFAAARWDEVELVAAPAPWTSPRLSTRRWNCMSRRRSQRRQRRKRKPSLRHRRRLQGRGSDSGGGAEEAPYVAPTMAGALAAREAGPAQATRGPLDAAGGTAGSARTTPAHAGRDRSAHAADHGRRAFPEPRPHPSPCWKPQLPSPNRRWK